MCTWVIELWNEGMEQANERARWHIFKALKPAKDFERKHFSRATVTFFHTFLSSSLTHHLFCSRSLPIHTIMYVSPSTLYTWSPSISTILAILTYPSWAFCFSFSQLFSHDFFYGFNPSSLVRDMFFGVDGDFVCDFSSSIAYIHHLPNLCRRHQRATAAAASAHENHFSKHPTPHGSKRSVSHITT